FPIAAHGLTRIQLEYEQLLAKQGRLSVYRFPLRTGSTGRRIGQLNINVTIHDSSPLGTIYSPSHRVTVERTGATQAVVRFAGRNVQLDRDFYATCSWTATSISTSPTPKPPTASPWPRTPP
ncbi:MAG: hypothetical protein ACYTGX_17700, partial [Planctomycetota bacterium]